MLGGKQEARMAHLPTDDEKARMALEVFEHFGKRPGEVLTQKNFVVIAAQRNWRIQDVSEGIERCADLGWFEQGPNNSIRLTEAGFAAI